MPHSRNWRQWLRELLTFSNPPNRREAHWRRMRRVFTPGVPARKR